MTKLLRQFPVLGKTGFPGGSDYKESACNAEDLGSTPGLGRPLGGGNGTPLQYSCLKNPMDRRAWKATVLGALGLPKCAQECPTSGAATPDAGEGPDATVVPQVIPKDAPPARAIVLLLWGCLSVLRSPLLLLPPIPPSIRVFSNESTLCMRWPKY